MASGSAGSLNKFKGKVFKFNASQVGLGKVDNKEEFRTRFAKHYSAMENVNLMYQLEKNTEWYGTETAINDAVTQKEGNKSLAQNMKQTGGQRPEKIPDPPEVSRKMTEEDVKVAASEANRKTRRKGRGRAGTFIVPVGSGGTGLPGKVGGGSSGLPVKVGGV
jgi:hypothetical protein